MPDVLENIWDKFRYELFDRSEDSLHAGDDEFYSCITKGLYASRDHVAAHCGACSDSLTCYFKQKNCKAVETDGSEYLVDFSWTTYNRIEDHLHLDCLPATGNYYGLLLACECEEGADGAVLYDFIKLVDLCCPIKIMAYRFDSRKEDKLQRLHGNFEMILNRHSGFKNNEAWLLLGVPIYRSDEYFRLQDARIHTVNSVQGHLSLVVPNWMQCSR